MRTMDLYVLVWDSRGWNKDGKLTGLVPRKPLVSWHKTCHLLWLGQAGESEPLCAKAGSKHAHEM